MGDRLSALDASFLYAESATTPMPDVDTLATLIEESLEELVSTVSGQ